MLNVYDVDAVYATSNKTPCPRCLAQMRRNIKDMEDEIRVTREDIEDFKRT